MFKRFIIILTIVSLLCSIMSLGFTATAYYEESILYGDVDDDGALTTEDARLALRMASGGVFPENEDQLERTDVNFDGAITLFDARQILRASVKLANLQPSGAFSGFEVEGIGIDEETAIAYFNKCLNRLKIVNSEDDKKIAVTILKSKENNLTDLNIEEVEIPAFSFGASAESVTAQVKESLISEEDEIEYTTISSGSANYDLLAVEGEDYVSNLSVNDVYGARVMYDDDTYHMTIEIALPDTEIETANQSAYAKVFNTTDLIAEQDTTLMKLMKASSGESATFREFKNCVLKVEIDVMTDNVELYTANFESHVYVAQTNFGLGSLSLAKLKDITFQKQHSIIYQDFQWLN
ncbi:MAG: dockerin type I repeat-containing protein [Acutalibacteraceae bacterium]|nr:dockerin type I repeat-containing protein [Acutalibacteraceae bacterium]